MKTMFKVLMFGAIFVDMRHLAKGMYETKTPVLFPADETIESLIEKNMQVTQRGTSVHESHSAMMSNLAKCSLVDVELSVILPEVEIPAENLEEVTEELTGPVEETDVDPNAELRAEAEEDVHQIPDPRFNSYVSGTDPIEMPDPASSVNEVEVPTEEVKKNLGTVES